MEQGQALLTGAGTSTGPPSGLPLGDAFNALLLECCFKAARRCAPDHVEQSTLEVLLRRPCNLLTRLAARAGHQVVLDLLDCFRVLVPTEAHLLTAALADRGVLVLTLNIDNGIEQAHALLRGDTDLPPAAPLAFHRALDGWRRRLRVRRRLEVVASGFADDDLQRRPLLVRLRGSADAGWHDSLVPQAGGHTAEMDANGFNEDVLAALRAGTQGRHLAIAGVSGNDRDCRASLLPLLRRGTFSWTCAELDAELVAVLRDIDTCQPILRPAVDGVGALFPDAVGLPAWPRQDPGGPGFASAFKRWRSDLRLGAAAATYADLLSDAHRTAEADALLAQLRATCATFQIEASPPDIAGDGRRGQVADGQAARDAPADPGG